MYGNIELELWNWNWRLQFQFHCLVSQKCIELELNYNSKFSNSMILNSISKSRILEFQIVIKLPTTHISHALHTFHTLHTLRKFHTPHKIHMPLILYTKYTYYTHFIHKIHTRHKFYMNTHTTTLYPKYTHYSQTKINLVQFKLLKISVFLIQIGKKIEN